MSPRTTPAVVPEAAPDIAEDELLQRLGFTRQLSRRVNAFGNWATSTAIISPITGIMYSLPLVMGAGGPAVMVWGWLGAGLMILFVGLSMAQITSRFPTSAGLYYWSGTMAKRHKKAWSWYTGWLNFVGQIGGTAGADYAAANFIQALLALQWHSYNPTARETYAIYGVILLVHAVANTFAVRAVAFLSKVAVFWLGVGALIIAGYLAAAPQHTSASFAFGHFVNSTGFRWSWYAGGVGLLLTMGTFTGFDASPHLSEETTAASVAAPRGIIRAILFSLATGFVLVVALAFAMTRYDDQAAAASPPLQILLDAGSATGAKLMMLIIIGAMLFCGLGNLTSNSRQIYAFSRDGAIPGSRRWRTVSERTRTPVNAVWFAAVCALALGLPSLWSSTTLSGILSINVIGLFSAYAIPIFLRLRLGAEFVPGPFTFRHSRVVAWIAIGWVALCTVLFSLPTASPVTLKNFNFAPIALGTTLVVATVWWFVVARRTYNPTIGSAAALAEISEVIV